VGSAIVRAVTAHEAGEVTIGPMQPVHRPQLRRIVAAAFSGEPFTIGMYGPIRSERYRRLLQDYQDYPSDRYDVTVAAVDQVVVALASLELPGDCGLCTRPMPELAADADAGAAIDHAFELRCRHAHASSGLPDDHARITTVATEPFLAGEGIGRRVVAAALDRAWAHGASCVALECLRSRAAFYAHLGFEEVVEFDDPGGPELRSLLMVARRP
jgi:GNAT superfamily N-acetyltransferase